MDSKIEVTKWTKYQIFLVCLLLISGSINTIIILWMNNTVSWGCHELYPFQHPFFQANLQYFGQVLCFFVIYALLKILSIRRDDSENRNWLTKGTRVFKLSAMWPPAMLDLFSLSALFIGITMTNHFSFQSLRGSIIIFTAIFSRCKLIKRQWIAVSIILFGLFTVGLGDVSHESGNESILIYAIKTGNISEIFFNSNFPIIFHCSNSTNNEMQHTMLLGDALIIFSQLIKAFQLIYEEIYIKEFDLLPLMVVGWEGVFDFLVMSSFISVFWLVPGDVMCQRDPIEAFTQIKNSSTLVILAVLLVVSNGVFTFSGMSITKEMSAITRAVLEITLLAIVWFLAVIIGWKKFHWLQIFGFIFVIIGGFLFNNVLIMQVIQFCKTGKWPKHTARNSPYCLENHEFAENLEICERRFKKLHLFRFQKTPTSTPKSTPKSTPRMSMLKQRESLRVNEVSEEKDE